ncbi:MAG: hypothetical protein R3336_06270 [Phycisphaeraceae bacterium]|nr:hypothetical protein [Phycisphaeraceae bacterium]
MGIIVHSPHGGEPVKVRDKDVGRAVRDREGRIFYVLEKSDGSGYYGAMTRTGSELDEQRAEEFEAKNSARAEQVQQQTAVHDATGPGRSGKRGKLVVLVLALIVVVLGWYFIFGPGAEMAQEWAEKAKQQNVLPSGDEAPTDPPIEPEPGS